ncbi:metallophosphoesterase [Tardiphaga sp. 538_B7_N1_4]|uniref:metallophosphoesterase n=1 Tax=Tardiphaga sp. 538_B7_N1_4 TaxID=3240778 RepID=UPI003F21328F
MNAVNNSTIYAIGDVHGCSDLLARLVDFIGNHAERNRRTPLVFFLGDIVDRGYYPLGAMIIVQDCIQRWPGSLRQRRAPSDREAPRGNHDETSGHPADEALP